MNHDNNNSDNTNNNNSNSNNNDNNDNNYNNSDDNGSLFCPSINATSQEEITALAKKIDENIDENELFDLKRGYEVDIVFSRHFQRLFLILSNINFTERYQLQ